MTPTADSLFNELTLVRPGRETETYTAPADGSVQVRQDARRLSVWFMDVEENQVQEFIFAHPIVQSFGENAIMFECFELSGVVEDTINARPTTVWLTRCHG